MSQGLEVLGSLSRDATHAVRRRRWPVLLCMLCFGGLLAAVPVAAQDEPGPTPATEVGAGEGAGPAGSAETSASLPGVAEAPADEDLRIRVRNLRDIVRTQNQVRADRARRQAELGTAAARGREDQIRSAIRQLSDGIRKLDDAFAIIAAEVSPSVLRANEEVEAVELTTEVKELLSPLVGELKRVTARPRQIDRLRTDIAAASERLASIEKAIANLDTLLAVSDSEEVLSALESEREQWESRRGTERTHLAVARQKLEQLLGDRQSLGQTLDGLFELFFKSRGRNLLIALLGTLVFWLVLRRLHDTIRRRSATHRGAPSLWTRVFDLVYMLLAGVGALLVFVLVLYSFGDWVLLIAVVLILLGLAWASKQAIPRFWAQAMLLLDMGPVRDGERVRYLGLPYRIASLGLYSELENPALAGGRIRLPIDDLSELRSRPCEPDEPWFPTRQGDWVVLQDGTYGRIVSQSTELVQLRRAGNTMRTYPTLDFLALAPDVITGGFLAVVHFGVDYRHQAEITDTVVEQLRAFVESGIEANGRSDWTRGLTVEFEYAGTSSLDLVVLWEVSGEAASHYFSVTRLINRLCVEACNEHGWEIPFSQVTVHGAGEG